jgi:hypothetical protein
LGSSGDGIVIAGQEHRPEDTGVPRLDECKADIAKYEPGTPLTDIFGVASCAAMQQFIALAKTLKGAITASTFLAAASAQTTVDSGIYATFSVTGPAPIASQPRVHNWGYLTWMAHGGKAVLTSPQFLQMANLAQLPTE